MTHTERLAADIKKLSSVEKLMLKVIMPPAKEETISTWENNGFLIYKQRCSLTS